MYNRMPSENLVRRQIYFIKSERMVKIGCSINIDRRIKEIQPWSPYPLELLAVMPGTVRIENAVHSMFEADWSHAEWFHLSADITAFIERIKDGNIPVLDEAPKSAYRRQVIEKRSNVPSLATIEKLEKALKEMES